MYMDVQLGPWDPGGVPNGANIWIKLGSLGSAGLVIEVPSEDHVYVYVVPSNTCHATTLATTLTLC